jgi:small subunit ribosomal protein S18
MTRAQRIRTTSRSRPCRVTDHIQGDIALGENEERDDAFDNDVNEEDDRLQQERPSRSTARRGGGERSRPSGRYRRSPRVCVFCADQSKRIDYKDVNTLHRFVSERGKIMPRRQTGTCSKHQRVLARAVKRARHLALLPFTTERTRES